MKKTVVFILAFLYLGITTGLAVNIHYCMGKIADVQLDNGSDESCRNCKTKMPCCNDHYQLVKVNDEHQQVTAAFTFETPQLQLHTFSNLIAQLSLPVVLHLDTQANPPPVLSLPDINIQNCVFRI